MTNYNMPTHVQIATQNASLYRSQVLLLFSILDRFCQPKELEWSTPGVTQWRMKLRVTAR